MPLFTTSTSTITVVIRPKFHSVTNTTDHEITVSASSSSPVLAVFPASQVIPKGKSVDFDLVAGDEVGTATITFKSGNEELSFTAHVAPNVEIKGHCFDGDTLVLMADGTTRAISALSAGDVVTTVDELDHLTARPRPTTGVVEAVLRHDGEREMMTCGGIAVTSNHRWAVRDPREPGFVGTGAMDTQRHELLAVSAGRVAWRSVPERTDAPTRAPIWNLTVSTRTFAVGRTPEGPFYVVHNSKPHDPKASDPETPLNPNFLEKTKP